MQATFWKPPLSISHWLMQFNLRQDCLNALFIERETRSSTPVPEGFGMAPDQVLQPSLIGWEICVFASVEPVSRTPGIWLHVSKLV